MNYARHTLCYLDRQATATNFHCSEHKSLFYYWLQRGYPFIFTRQPLDIAPDKIQLAIAYFKVQQAQKLRSNYVIDTLWVSKVEELPTLQRIFPYLEHCTAFDIKVYGSYCWQYLTQEPYVQPSSDLDLLVRYEHQSQLILAKLHQELQAKLNVSCIDGEVRFAQLGDCSWQELVHTSSDSILFKSMNNVVLLRREQLYDMYPALFS